MYHVSWFSIIKLKNFQLKFDIIYTLFVIDYDYASNISYFVSNIHSREFYACIRLAITKYISIKTILPLVLNPKHIKVCFHFLNFPLIKFHLRGFHLLQNIFSGPSFTNAYSSYNSYNDGDKKVCQVKQVFMGMHEYNFLYLLF